MINLQDILFEPFHYAFMQKALWVCLLASVNCAWVGTYLVLRRMAFMGEALAHTILPGVVFAYIRGFQLFWGALGASLMTALGVSFLMRYQALRQDTAIGIILSGMFALGVAMMSFVGSFKDFGSLLFGSILSVGNYDILLLIITACIIFVILFFLHKEFELSSFDPDYAQVIGITHHRLHTLLLVLIALSVVSAVKIMGALLTTALMITPPATACLVGRTLPAILVIGTGVSIVSCVCGLYISFYYPIASGASIVLCASLIFILVWAYKQIALLFRTSYVFHK